MNIFKKIAISGLRQGPCRKGKCTSFCNHSYFPLINTATFHTMMKKNKSTEGMVEKNSNEEGFVYRLFRNRRFSAKSAAPSKQQLTEELQAIDNVCLKIDQWSDLVGRDFLSVKHFKKEDLYQFLWTAKDLKHRLKDNKEQLELFKGVNAIGIFHSKSAASRISFELAVSKLGGTVTYVTPKDVESVAGSSMKDAAKYLSGIADFIIAGGYSQETVDALACESSSPVISAFSSQLNPLQTMSQFLTLLEYFNYLRGLKLSWVGTSNNVLNSLLYGCAKLGIDFRVATPPGYEADPALTADAMKIAGKTGASFLVGNDPIQAVYRTDALLTGPWPAPGKDGEVLQLQKDFEKFKINRKLLKEADGDWVFMHSMPRSSVEVTDDIFYGLESVVHKEIENRMWTAMAIMLHLNQAYAPIIPIPKFVRC